MSLIPQYLSQKSVSSKLGVPAWCTSEYISHTKFTFYTELQYLSNAEIKAGLSLSRCIAARRLQAFRFKPSEPS